MWYYYLVHYLPWALFIGPLLLWIFLRVRTEQRWRWVLVPLCAAALAVSAVLVAATVPTSASNGWCASRLSVPIAWVFGDHLYYGPGEGPALVRMYGPVYAMVYAPTALAWRPTVALLLGTAINLALFVTATAWFLRRCGADASGAAKLAVAAVFALTAALGCPLLDIAALVTVDAPAIAFGACACAVLVGHKADTVSTRTAIACGLFAAASIWTKQTLAPIVLALALYMLLIAPIRYAITMLLTVGLVSSIILLLFGPDRMLYQMAVVPSLHPTNWPWLGRRGAMIRGLWFAWGEVQLVGWMALAAMALRRDLPTRLQMAEVRDWARRSPWLLTLFVALFVLPTTMMAYVKLAGNNNNVAPLCYFGLLTFAGAVLGLCRRSPEEPKSTTQPPRVRLALMGMAALLLVLPWAQRKAMMKSLGGLHAWAGLADTEQEQAFRYIKEHPREAFFPQYPLASVLADHQPYHFDEAMKDYERAQIPITEQQLRAGLPPHLREIVLHGPARGSILQLLPQFDQVSEPPELPGWQVLTAREPAP